MPANKLQPEFLKPGDKVGIVSPSFHIEEQKITNAVSVLESWGLKTIVGEHALKKNGLFAGSDIERLADLQEMTDDNDIKAVICSRGGYGVSRIISDVDFSNLKLSPKWYVGFSDITVLHMCLSEVYGIMSLHGEMPVNYGNTEKSNISLNSIRKALFGEKLSYEWDGPFVRPVSVNGEVTGGNLSLLCSLLGTFSEPLTKGKILFIEDIGEYYYRIDRMMTSLKLAGKLEGLAALLIGGMNDMKETSNPWGKTIIETITEIAGEYSYPLFFNFPAGHIEENMAFYIGKHASISISGKIASLRFS